jgi:hypothetical protein
VEVGAGVSDEVLQGEAEVVTMEAGQEDDQMLLALGRCSAVLEQAKLGFGQCLVAYGTGSGHSSEMTSGASERRTRQPDLGSSVTAQCGGARSRGRPQREE